MALRRRIPATARRRPSAARSKPRSAHVALDAATLARVARRFAALADPSRLAVLQAVCGGAATVSAVAAVAGMGISGASRHLTRLAREAFVVREPTGRAVRYRLADDTPLALCAAICAHLQASGARPARR